MLSQLCRAKPLLKSPVKTRFNSKISASQSCIQSNLNIPAAQVDEGEESNCCQLEHCSFCANRVCCIVNSGTQEQEEPINHSSILDTENPAYGLFSRNWLEWQQMEAPSNEVNYSQQGMDKNTERKHTLNMNYVNISTHTLASIPESRDESASLRMSKSPPQTETKVELKGSKFSGCSYPKSRHSESQTEGHKQDEHVIENAKTCDISCDNMRAKHNENNDIKMINTRQKSLPKEKTTLSIIKPQLKLNERRHQESTHYNPPKTKSETSRFRKLPPKVKYLCNSTRQPQGGLDNIKQASTLLGFDRLSEITSVKTEESIQEWLTRISEWVDSNSWIQDGCCDEDEGISNELEDSFYDKEHDSTHDTTKQNFDSRLRESQSNSQEMKDLDHSTSDHPRDVPLNIKEVLSKATKDIPANIPMVVMQCSRLHSHIAKKPPFQQTSLPMGTLVTALYQESDWLYIQTPHGIEGFVSSSNCVPIGTTQKFNESKKPWEPCDCPISISIKNTSYFGAQQGSFVPAKLPVCGGKRPFVNMVKMKTSFYSDRHLNYTFKPKDSIKTAKTVTDILKSSPEIEINN